jgi:hypothetical protein
MCRWFSFHKPNGDRAICHYGIFDADLSQSLWTAPGNVEIVSDHVLSVRIDKILCHGPPCTIHASLCACLRLRSALALQNCPLCLETNLFESCFQDKVSLDHSRMVVVAECPFFVCQLLLSTVELLLLKAQRQTPSTHIEPARHFRGVYVEAYNGR